MPRTAGILSSSMRGNGLFVNNFVLVSSDCFMLQYPELCGKVSAYCVCRKPVCEFLPECKYGHSWYFSSIILSLYQVTASSRFLLISILAMPNHIEYIKSQSLLSALIRRTFAPIGNICSIAPFFPIAATLPLVSGRTG